MPEGPVVNTNLGPALQATANPIASAGGVVGIMNDLAELKNRQNTAALFQQTMSARQAAGETIATMSGAGASPDQILTKLRSMPGASFIAPEIEAYARSGQTQVETAKAGEEIKRVQAETARAKAETTKVGPEIARIQAATGAELASKAATEQGIAAKNVGMVSQLAAASNGTIDPNMIAAWKAALPKDQADRVDDVVKALNASYTTGLPKDPEAAAKLLAERKGALAISLGAQPDNIMQLPGQPKIAAKGFEMPGGGISVAGGYNTSPALVETPPSGGAAGSVPSSVPSTESPKSIDGSALFAPDSQLPKQYKTNLTGTAAYPSKAYEQNVAGLMKSWTEEQPEFQKMAQANATLESMAQEFRAASKGGGWLTPGFAGEARVKLANGINTMYSIFNPGEKLPMDPVKLAADESAMKHASTLSFQVVAQALGVGREALGTIQMGYNSIPNIDRTPLGNMLLSEWLQTAGKWALEKQAFKADWAARTNGDLTGADAAYLKDHPPEKALNQVLASHGIGEDGYADTPEGKKAFMQDYSSGLLISGKEHPYQTFAETAHEKGWMADDTYEKMKKNGFKVPPGELK